MWTGLSLASMKSGRQRRDFRFVRARCGPNGPNPNLDSEADENKSQQGCRPTRRSMENMPTP
jgi:hypothetical protein